MAEYWTNELNPGVFCEAALQATECIMITTGQAEELGPKIVFVNPAFCALSGYRAEELLGQSPRILQGPRTDPIQVDELRRALRQGRPFEGQLWNYRKDGSAYLAEWRIAPLCDGAGEVTHYVSVQRDVTPEHDTREALQQAQGEMESRVKERTAELAHANDVLRSEVTERRRAEEALSLNQQRLKAIFDSTQEGMLLSDSRARYVDVNEAACIITGYSRDELLRLSLWDISPLPHHRSTWELWRSLLAQGRQQGETLLVRKDGTRIAIEYSAVADIVPGLHLLVMRDITDKQKAEAALRDSEERFRQLAENINSVFWIMEVPSRTVTYVSPAFDHIWGFSPGDVNVGYSYWLEAVHPEDRPNIESALHTRLMKGEYDEEFRVVRPDGAIRWVRDRAFPLRNARDEVYRIVGIAEDISERKASEEAVRKAKQEADRANQAKSEFLSRMSHELRTPLHAIIGFAQLMAMDERTPLEKENLEHILKAGRHLLNLINEVLDITRIESGRLSLSIEPVRVAAVLSEVEALVRPQAQHSNISIEVECDEKQYVLADRQRFKQVLLNLFSNAVKYNSPEGRIECQLELRADGRAAVHVSDTGAGIAEAKLERLFVPFDRLGAEHTEVEGTGIGLALSRRLVEAMGGVISVRSTEGEGTTFSVDLPQGHDPLDKADEEVENATTETAPLLQEAWTILYIEDNLPNLTLVERILSRHPKVNLLAAMQGGLGLELAREHAINLVLLDVHLPDMEGDEVLHRLKSDPRTADIPVIILSADATQNRIDKLRAAGAYAYFTKPLQVKEFLHVIEAALKRGS